MYVYIYKYVCMYIFFHKKGNFLSQSYTTPKTSYIII